MKTFEQEMAELEEQIRIEDERQAAFDLLLNRAIEIGKINALEAIDQQIDYSSWYEAKEGYSQNVSDTLYEQGISKHPTYGFFFIVQADKAFDSVISEYEAKQV